MMLRLLSENCTVRGTDKELLRYGIEVFFYNTGVIAFFMILSILLNDFVSSFVYLVCLSVLRVFTGGWHASTKATCFFSYTFLYFLFQTTKQIPISDMSLSLLMLTCSLYIFLRAPVSHFLQPLDEKEQKENRKNARISILCILFIYLFFVSIHSALSVSVAIAVLLNVCLMILLQITKGEIC